MRLLRKPSDYKTRAPFNSAASQVPEQRGGLYDQMIEARRERRALLREHGLITEQVRPIVATQGLTVAQARRVYDLDDVAHPVDGDLSTRRAA